MGKLDYFGIIIVTRLESAVLAWRKLVITTGVYYSAIPRKSVQH
jgi:hypothetical protein